MNTNNKGYNGHKNWNHWNVSLWINNDEGLYNTAMYCLKMGKTKPIAAMYFMRELDEQGITHTPDGAPYSYTTVRASLSSFD